ncbi:phosphotransferase [Corynebacterium sp. H130]|uniref:phosphotransferase n=1 Tax=Corynebacterium sp. H130 TaxID=3133444 RepID=UPI0030B4B2EB
MYEDIAQQRFFRSKQAGITNLTELRSAPCGPARWVLADVDGDLYQLVLSEDRDVLHTQEVLDAVAQCFATGKAVGDGTLVVVSDPVLPEPAEVSVSGAEQSNSSLIFKGESPAIAKFFRKLEPGINPEVELLEGLAKVGCAYVPRLRAYSHIEWDGDTYVTAMVQDFAQGSREGWDLITSRAGAGAPCADEAELIGQAMGQIHRDLAEAFGTAEVPANRIVSGLVDRMETLIKQAPVLADYGGQIRAVYREAAAGTTTVQRIHGDAHLGQILRTNDRYLFIDFEGEPARPLAERRQMFSPLQDVAGLLRSFDYAAHFEGTLDNPDEWLADCSQSLLQAYGAKESPLLTALIVDKALYEVAYEVNNRPDWVHIPLGAVRRLLSK